MATCKWEGCEGWRGEGGGLFPLNEAWRRYDQHPPIVATLRKRVGMGRRLDVDEQEEARGWRVEWGWRGGVRRQTGSSCTRAGGQVMSGEGWIKQINT